MAARKIRGTKTSPWDEKVRQRIRAGMLEKKLMEHVDGTREMSQTQFQAAKTLLGKVLPDLASIEHSTDPNKPMTITLAWSK